MKSSLVGYPSSGQLTDGAELHRAAEPARDQGYLLAATTRAQLAMACPPLGDVPDKAALHAALARLDLAVVQQPDSRDIRFAPGCRPSR